MPTTVKRLVEVGVTPALAKEVVARQVAATDTSAGRKRLTELGMVPRHARELSKQVAGAKNVKAFVELGIPPRIAAEFVK